MLRGPSILLHQVVEHVSNGVHEGLDISEFVWQNVFKIENWARSWIGGASAMVEPRRVFKLGHDIDRIGKGLVVDKWDHQAVVEADNIGFKAAAST